MNPDRMPVETFGTVLVTDPVETFGAWSLFPPLFAIILAIVTRQAVLSLFLGVWSGGVLFTFPNSTNVARDLLEVVGLGDVSPLAWVIGLVISFFWGVIQALDWLVTSVGESVFHAQIIVFTLLLGSAVAMIWKLGGSYAVRDWALERIDTQKQSGLATWALGLVMFFDDYANTAIVGSTMKDVSDKLRVSKEKFSYIVDSTAAPVATLALSSWVAFQLGMIESGYEATDLEPGEIPSAFSVFLESIPFNMYSILAIVMVGIIVWTGRDYGEMLTAEHRSWTTGNVSRENAVPLQEIEADLGEPYVESGKLQVFFVPVAVLIAITVLAGLWTGYEAGAGVTDWVTNADYASSLLYGSFAMVVTTFYYGLREDIISLQDGVETIISGFSIMLTAISILVLAWSIGIVVDQLGTGDYVVGVIEWLQEIGWLPLVEILPAVVLLLAAFVAFSTGTSWGTMGIMTPSAVPVAWGLTGDHTVVAVMVGTIFSGAIFGDHSSPISDTTVLSATFTGADLIDHVRTQLYYAATVALVAMFLLLVWGFGTNVWGVSIPVAIGLLPVGVAILYGLVYGLSEWDADRKGIEPIAVRAEMEETDPDLGGGGIAAGSTDAGTSGDTGAD